MIFNQKEIGIRIRSERLKNRLTIEKLCEMLEVSPSFIGLVERGESGISLEKLYKLTEIFQVSADYLIKGIDSPHTNPQHQERSKIAILNTYLYDYTDEELDFVLDMLKFLKPRVAIK